MTQFDLFKAQRVIPEPAPLDPVLIRKHLFRALRRISAAQQLPWHGAELERWTREFPQLATVLPPEEAEPMIAAFTRELERLRAS